MSSSSSAALLETPITQTLLVHSITNWAVMNFTANAVLAIGAALVMVGIGGEASPLARPAGGSLLNLGIPTREQRAVSEEAVSAANEAGTLCVLAWVAVTRWGL